ncbi:MAG: nitrous oxidase accessory protein [Candidatus Argoarchaeum ethanivorans]|uniref:Nitrous oxidase accessory protein n=1 Tax=Candidatus Argoarchaeum ethanivorans TaxID=2608793 RepID=A0A8B3S0K6_9EURY|nr:MAG: nitrous oxidase accessory protein [Candidatus Argoarchaeum ethanivorans]
MKSKRNGFWNIPVFALLFAILAVISIGCASADTIYVPEEGNQTIQQAVNNASEGDTIIVRDGTYTENVDVNKRLTIKSENGSACCFVDATGKSYGFVVTVDYVNITGFTVTNASSVGVYLGGAWYCNISDNTASDNGYCGIWLYSSSNNNMLINNNASNNGDDGIYIHSSNNNTLTDNTINNNSDDGIYIYYSNNTTLTENTVDYNGDDGVYMEHSDSNRLTNNNPSNNGNDGIYLRSSDYNTLTNNIASKNRFHGIYLEYWCNNNTLIGNNASNNYEGIMLSFSSNNNLTNNTANNNDCGGVHLDSSDSNTFIGNNASNNNNDGICLYGSSNNALTSNIILDNDHGIYLHQSCNNRITSNTADSNNDDGIRLQWSSNNNILYHNNLINNTNYNAYDDGINQWDSGSEGNYYSDYTGTDLDDDGIGTDPYPIHDGSSIDRFPLMHPWGKPPLKGDLDDDDKITSTDAAIALQIAVGSRPFDDAADVSGDGRVSSLDALMILQKITLKNY